MEYSIHQAPICQSIMAPIQLTLFSVKVYMLQYFTEQTLSITGFPPCTNMSDPMCKQRMMAQQEIQIETPYGEMDMEPGEMDLEGAAASQLLKTLGMGGPNMNPHMQEINLNQNVLKALKQRFGVNTTAGIRRMSSNPEFQAFMYRVLTHSAPLAPGEYNANLTQAEVNWILNDLAASTSNHRLTTGNLDHAKLNTQNSTSTSGQKTSNTVLTINGGPNQNNPWAQFNPGMAAFPGFPSAQVQDPSQAVSQPGIVQALVQGMLGGEGGEQTEGTGGGERGEAEEKKTNGTQAEPGETTAGKGAETQTNATKAVDKGSVGSTAGLTGSNTNQATAISKEKVNSVLQTENTKTNPANTNANPASNKPPRPNPQSQPTNTQPSGKEADIIGKEGKFGISKDQRTRNQQGSLDPALSGAGANPEVGATNPPINRDNIPIGIKEAGLDTASIVNTTIEQPVEALPAGYASSTAFAIAAITMIILAIIVGPILCYLCKLKEKRDERLRKEKALKNREVSENSIMESMVLHDFGQEASNTVANDGASPYGDRYTALDTDIADIERFKKTGYLP